MGIRYTFLEDRENLKKKECTIHTLSVRPQSGYTSNITYRSKTSGYPIYNPQLTKAGSLTSGYPTKICKHPDVSFSEIIDHIVKNDNKVEIITQQKRILFIHVFDFQDEISSLFLFLSHEGKYHYGVTISEIEFNETPVSIYGYEILSRYDVRIETDRGFISFSTYYYPVTKSGT